MKLVAASLMTCALLAGCGGRDPVADEAGNTANLAAVVQEANATAEAAQNRAEGSAEEAAAPQQQPTSATGPIPAALQGRWGLTPVDCTTALGDAKGLLVINSGELRFYESRAVPAANLTATGNSVSGNFNFTGEGQTWTKSETLERKGDKLVRTETKPTGSFTYARCE